MAITRPTTRFIRLAHISLIISTLSWACLGQTIKVPYQPPAGAAPAAPPPPPPPEQGRGGQQPPPASGGKQSSLPCWLLPLRKGCAKGTDQIDFINTFYQTSGSLSYLNQIKSIYNGASASATVSANLASLNFMNGMQVSADTNVQAGSVGATTSTSSSSVPTLSSAGAAQAVQNTIYGGTVVAAVAYPLVGLGSAGVNNPGNLGLRIDFVTRGGVDIQNFNSGTSVNVSSPPFHGAAQIQGYLLYNSINKSPNDSSIFAGSIFIGGSYGYNYMSHDYANNYGFGRNLNSGVGQVSFGILINGVAKIAISRAFGPSQTYINSATMSQTTVDNFKAWSIGISYQTAPASSTTPNAKPAGGS